jgi:ABC-type iron transport system FetAB ATPase subunit
VEETILDEIKDEGRVLRAVVWITHSEEQAHRVGTRFLHVTSEGIEEEEVNGSGSV